MIGDCVMRAPRRPTVVAWAAFFNVVHIALLGCAATFCLNERGGEPFALFAFGAMAPYLLLLLGLRRGAAWAWIGQLVLICLMLGLTSIPGLIWLPLLIAWCSSPVRDWFDPPMRRTFG